MFDQPLLDVEKLNRAWMARIEPEQEKPSDAHAAGPNIYNAQVGKTTGGIESKPTNPKDAIGITKLPMHLVSPIVKAYQSIAHFLGNVKYGAWNYRGSGIRNSVYRAALERHVDAWWEGEEYDPTDGTPHLANAQACLNILIEGKYTSSTIDDRPPSRAEVLRKVRAELEALMPLIRERYKSMNPHHYTIADKEAK